MPTHLDDEMMQEVRVGGMENVDKEAKWAARGGDLGPLNSLEHRRTRALETFLDIFD